MIFAEVHDNLAAGHWLAVWATVVVLPGITPSLVFSAQRTQSSQMKMPSCLDEPLSEIAIGHRNCIVAQNCLS